MGREKDETQEQYLKRCRQAERERKILSYAPYFWVALFLVSSFYFMFIHEEYVDPRYIVPEEIRNIKPGAG